MTRYEKGKQYIFTSKITLPDIKEGQQRVFIVTSLNENGSVTCVSVSDDSKRFKNGEIYTFVRGSATYSLSIPYNEYDENII